MCTSARYLRFSLSKVTGVSLLGIYGFPADVVAASTYDALLGFDIYLKSLPAGQRILRSIAFVNIDDIVTKSLIMTFTHFVREHSMEKLSSPISPRSFVDGNVSIGEEIGVNVSLI